MTAKTDTLASAMALAFAEIEGATKDKTNPHFNSKYADLGSVIAAIKPALVKHELWFSQSTEPSEGGVIVETNLIHASGAAMSFGKLFVPANKQDAQGFGSALTYARRYSLMTAFGVPAEDDDGNAAAQSYTARSGPPANGNGHHAQMANDADAPFPQGPAKNKTALKELGRGLWKEVLACGDRETLDVLLISHKPLVEQLKAGLPQWWGGGTRDGETYEGLGQVIERMERDFDALQGTQLPRQQSVLEAG